MVGIDDIVITGLGCVTPIGIGRNAFWQALSCGKCATRAIYSSTAGDRVLFGAAIPDFDGKQYVVPRKSLKLMSTEVQIAYAAAHLAWEDAGLTAQQPDPERIGVVFGSEMIPGDIGDLTTAVRSCSSGLQMDTSRWGTEFAKGIFPLWMLRNLPNMPPCHIAIAVDARGPNNTLVQEEISGLLALGEAVGIMHRGDADVMVVGAMGSRITPTRLAYHMRDFYMETGSAAPTAVGRSNDQLDSQRQAEENGFYSRAFDARRCGIVPSEAAVVMVLEKRRHAVARSAKICGTLLSTVGRHGRPERPHGGSSTAIAQAARSAIELSGLTPNDLACVSAQGYSHDILDRSEAAAIQQFAPDVPVTAYSSYFGTAGAASGLLQLASGMLATCSRKILPILGYDTPDPTCPVLACQAPQGTSKSFLLQLSFTLEGQAAATIVDCH